MQEILTETRNGAVSTLVLNRPEKMNALNQALIAKLTETFLRLSRDDSLRAIIVTGAGKAFCGGVDLKELAQSDDVASALEWRGERSLINVVRACPHPVIMAVNGFAVTGGLELALMGDFIIASESARFADTHARVGITPSWGMTQILPRLIGPNRARQMSLTGEFVSADVAERWGLANEVVPDKALMARAETLAQQICETDGQTMTSIRNLIFQSTQLGLDVGLAREQALFAEHILSVSGNAVERQRQAVTQRGREINKT